MTVTRPNAIADPTATLQAFTLQDLAQYTLEREFPPDASKDVRWFYVGRDDVHNVLKHVLSRVTTSLVLNMFGYDDPELNEILLSLAQNPNVTMLVTLDKSQAGGKHERQLLDLDRAKLASFGTHFVIGQSATHSISHTKGFVADGRVAVEGSTNWSADGEGTFVIAGKPGGPGYRAQNNTLTVTTDRETIHSFQARLIHEHMIAQGQQTP